MDTSTASTAVHNRTVSTSALLPGDVLLANGRRIVARTERNMDNLGAYQVYFTDGSWDWSGDRDPHAIHRAGA